MRIAVLGLGWAGSRHARLLLELGHDVVGFDPVASAPEGIEQADSLASAIARSEAVVVASPSSLHAEQTVAAIEHGKHALVEKPFATIAADAERMVEAAAQAGVVCGVAMNLRFDPGLLELKRVVDEDLLGPVRFVQASFGFDLRLWHPEEDYRRGYSARSELGGGIVLDAIHELDYLLWLLGPVATVRAEVGHVSDLEVDVEDIAVAILKFESGALGSVDLNFFEPAYRRSCIVVGDRADARWERREGRVTIIREGDDDHVTEVGRELIATYRGELVDFLDAVTQGTETRTTARDGLEAVRLAEAVKLSSLAGRRIDLRPE